MNLFTIESNSVFFGWFFYCVTSVLLAATGSALCVWVVPTAKGAGIAEVKAFLNGVKFPGFFSLK